MRKVMAYFRLHNSSIPGKSKSFTFRPNSHIIFEAESASCQVCKEVGAWSAHPPTLSAEDKDAFSRTSITTDGMVVVLN
jgi:hypothetical protein